MVMRIGRGSNFRAASAPLASPVPPTPLAPQRKPQPKPKMAQAVVVESPEAAELKRFLDEAKEQLAGIDRNYSNLIVALGTEGAQQARAQAVATVEMYQSQYNRMVGVAR